MSQVATVPASNEETKLGSAVLSSATQPETCMVLTTLGVQAEAQAKAEGKSLNITSIAVGDGGGSVPTPSQDVTALVNQVYKKAVDSVSQDQNDPNICWVHMVIPADVGGFYIREIGVFAQIEGINTEILYAYGNQSPFYKTLSQSGNVCTYEISLPIIVTSSSNVNITINEAGYATRALLLSHEEQDFINTMRMYRQMINLSDRLTKDQLNRIKNKFPGGVVVTRPTTASISAAGITDLQGNRVAPITITNNVSTAPAGAALVLEVQDFVE